MTGKPAAKNNYDSTIERFLKSDMDITPLLNGIADAETAMEWLGEANRCNADTKTKEQIAQRIKELQ